jgi:hypothetical protein
LWEGLGEGAFGAAPSKATATTIQQKLIQAVIQDQAGQVAKLLSQGGDPNAGSWFAPEDQSIVKETEVEQMLRKAGAAK